MAGMFIFLAIGAALFAHVIYVRARYRTVPEAWALALDNGCRAAINKVIGLFKREQTPDTDSTDDHLPY